MVETVEDVIEKSVQFDARGYEQGVLRWAVQQASVT
ncbi:hypothetical protein SAMN05444172_3863 [Burkholderia sp. GAS332]|nr:hypothetical protein SAMN05444172_3863 [Burkholderia sp. GAS332]